MAQLTRARIQINADPKWTPKIHIASTRYTADLDSHLYVDFYCVLKRDAIRARSLLVHTFTYALIVVFESTAHAAIYAV